jgi:uncharacterized protein (DUF486 family)
MRTILLLIGSNMIMVVAWYAHLRFPGRPIHHAIVVSWLIAFFEYCLAVPANRIGWFEEGFTGAQLKIIQEVITLVVFAGFSVLVLGEKLRWNYLAALACLLGAVYFIFRR